LYHQASCLLHALQDTKPWRLHPPLPVHWFDIDQPAVMQLKQQLLQRAGAAVAPQDCSNAAILSQTAGSIAAAQDTMADEDATSFIGSASATTSRQQQKQQERDVNQFPLLPQQYSPLAADLAVVPLASCLEAAGFQHQRPTVWVAEALLYYLPLEVVSSSCNSSRGRLILQTLTGVFPCVTQLS
jgi:hypothetical protein